jgi:arylsulfatase A
LVVDEAVQWLQQKRDPSKPFFLTVWTHEPHYPIKSDPKYKALYPHLTDDVQKEHHANITQMDDAFGRLIRALDQLKLADDTFLFFTSDNGPDGDGIKAPGRGSSGGLRGRKVDLHEGGIRVPGIARWPGKIAPNTTVHAPVIGSDLLPTVLALAGTTPPKQTVLDGVDVLPLLTGTASKVERPQPLFWRLNMARNAKFAMRLEAWKILSNDTLTEFELYNLEKDPAETTDLKEAEPERFGALRERLLAHTAAVEAEGPDWWKRLSASGGKPQKNPPAPSESK